MRNLLTGAAVLMLLPAVAQAQPGQGRGGGPPVTPPGQPGAGGVDRGQMGRDIGVQQRGRADARRDAARQNANRRGQPDATGLARARQVAAPQAHFGLTQAEMARLHAQDFDMIERDLEDWRRDFRIGRAQWQEERDRWLELRRTMTPQQWLAVREDWMTRHAQWQQLRNTWRQRHTGMGGPLEIDD